jgi:hypothetical protein
MNTVLAQDPIWYQNIRVLLLRPKEIIPTRDQSDAERVNAIVRLVLYCSAVVALIRGNAMYLVLGLAIITIVSLSFALGGKKKIKNESYANLRPDSVKRARKMSSPPTKDNPYSNATVGALLDDPGRAPASGYDSPGVANQQRKFFNQGLFRNLDDVYEKSNSQRQFLTMPSTTAAPDTIAFAHFCAGSRGKTCKEDPSMCEPRFAARD